MNTRKLEKVIKELIENDVLDAISEVDLSAYISSKQIAIWVEKVIRDRVALIVSEKVEIKIVQEIRKYEAQLDSEIERTVFEEVSKQLKL